ncbi:uncharacterized protein BDV14DRAFT_174038 [Aspergillus stella-maris]|uniref:uncharacterized protein n=1 Tax=Aspergillus stella-maris TaxID=1810926 RepID=UPI003CCD6AB6
MATPQSAPACNVQTYGKSLIALKPIPPYVLSAGDSYHPDRRRCLKTVGKERQSKRKACKACVQTKLRCSMSRSACSQCLQVEPCVNTLCSPYQCNLRIRPWTRLRMCYHSWKG